MRPHRSHSQLTGYTECGHRYYLQRVLRRPESPCVWFPAGKAFHTVTEALDRDLVNDVLKLTYAANEALPAWQDEFTIAFEAELDVFRKDFPDESKWRAAGKATKEKPNKEDVLWWHTFGRSLVETYIQWRISSHATWEIAEFDGKLAIEMEVMLPLGGVPMKGYVDRVLRSKLDGRLLVMDLKSGSRTPFSPMQLALYSVQLEPLLGGEMVLWGAWYDARKGVLGQPIDLSMWTEQLLGGVYSQLDAGINAGIFLPTIDSHCTNCGVKRFCKFQGGREDAA